MSKKEWTSIGLYKHSFLEACTNEKIIWDAARYPNPLFYIY